MKKENILQGDHKKRGFYTLTKKDTIAIIILIIILADIYWKMFLLGALGNILWLPIITSIIIVTVIIITKNKLINLCILLLIFNIVIPAVIYVGAKDRNLTDKEKQYILTYLSEKYANEDFKIEKSKSINKSLRGGPSISIGFTTYNWENLDIEIANNKGQKFKVIGHNKGFNNITFLIDDYDVISSLYRSKLFLKNKISEFKTNIEEDNIETDYYISLTIDIDYSYTLKKDLDKLAQESYIQEIKQDIITKGYCKDVRIDINYKMNDGIIKYPW